MGFKKYDGSAWQAITPKKLKGIPYTGTLPATITGTKAGYLHRYKVYGNTVQNGTPTPENPIVPSECGERTENLFNISLVEQGGWSAPAGSMPTKNGATIRTRYNQIIPLLATTLSLYCPSNVKINYVWIDVNGISLGGSGWQKNGDTAIAPEQAVSMTFILGLDNDVNCTPSDFYDITIVAGSTAPTSYIPYGYKLPLTSAGQNVDIYLGESQTTRRIKKLVLTGEETWYFFNLGEVVWQFYTNNIISGLASSSCMSNIAEYGVTGNTRVDYDYGAYLVSSGRGVAFQMRGSKDTFVDVDAWKAYLAQQYAAGTPVTVWYILETEETGVVNEPLRKIGDYADTIDSTQTSAQIPTTAGSTTISWAGEGLAPSEFDSIQEWVDIPTYTYTNGEWVADNSN